MTKSPKKCWRCLLNSKKDWRFRHLFVAFSEYMNFNTIPVMWSFLNFCHCVSGLAAAHNDVVMKFLWFWSQSISIPGMLFTLQTALLCKIQEANYYWTNLVMHSRPKRHKIVLWLSLFYIFGPIRSKLDPFVQHSGGELFQDKLGDAQ